MSDGLLPIDLTEVAWAAGFFDGEGHVGLNGTPSAEGKSTLTVRVEQVGSREELDRFQRAVGVGTVRGPYQRSNPRYRPHYLFGAYGKNAHAAMRVLRPFLSSRKLADYWSALDSAVSYE